MHLADLVVARSIIGCAARPSSALRYNVLMRAYQGMRVRLNVRHRFKLFSLNIARRVNEIQRYGFH